MTVNNEIIDLLEFFLFCWSIGEEKKGSRRDLKPRLGKKRNELRLIFKVVAVFVENFSFKFYTVKCLFGVFHSWNIIDRLFCKLMILLLLTRQLFNYTKVIDLRRFLCTKYLPLSSIKTAYVHLTFIDSFHC